MNSLLSPHPAVSRAVISLPEYIRAKINLRGLYQQCLKLMLRAEIPHCRGSICATRRESVQIRRRVGAGLSEPDFPLAE
jgi:hypothetical protein